MQNLKISYYQIESSNNLDDKFFPRCAKKVQYEEIFSYNLMYYEAMEQHNPIMALAVGK